eukprot:gene21888-biopygen7646
MKPLIAFDFAPGGTKSNAIKALSPVLGTTLSQKGSPEVSIQSESALMRHLLNNVVAYLVSPLGLANYNQISLTTLSQKGSPEVSSDT